MTRSKEAIHALAATDPLNAYTRAGYAQELRVSGRNLVGTCPFHADDDPSFCVTRSGEYAGRWKCFGCGLGGDLIAFYQRLHRGSFSEALTALNALLGGSVFPERVRPSKFRQQGKAAQPAPVDPIPQTIAQQCHQELLRRPKALDWLIRRKGLPAWILGDALIGYSEGHWREPRFTIPVPCGDAEAFSDIRGYRPNPKPGQPKMLPWERGRGGPVIYPWPWAKEADEIVWCEGEIDALNLIARGVVAVTATCGVDGAVGKGLAIPDLSGKTVCVLGDHDSAGERLSDKLPARLYAAGAVEVMRLKWPDAFPDGTPLPKGYDLSDWCADGATAEDVWRLIHG
ncbi:MAG: toprim domain-containing protein [Armatimonadetes bacterium]|nr:toprim domain-containing protein [Armatimonadota bacterium]